MAGSSRSTVTMAAVRPISIGVRTDSVIAPSYPDRAGMVGRYATRNGPISSFQGQTERLCFRRRLTSANHLDRRHHASLPIEYAISERHDAYLGGRGWRRLAQRPGDRIFIALRVEGACGDERARRRTADTGVAVNDQRPGAIPALYKGNELGHVLIRRSDVAGEWLRDIVHAEDEVVCRCNRVGPSNEVNILEQGHDVVRAGVLDGPVEARKRTDVNHWLLIE